MKKQVVNLRTGRPFGGMGCADNEREYERLCSEMRASITVRYAAGPRGYILPNGTEIPPGAEITADMLPGETLGERRRLLDKLVWEQRVVEALNVVPEVY